MIEFLQIREKKERKERNLNCPKLMLKPFQTSAVPAPPTSKLFLFNHGEKERKKNNSALKVLSPANVSLQTLSAVIGLAVASPMVDLLRFE